MEVDVREVPDWVLVECGVCDVCVVLPVCGSVFCEVWVELIDELHVLWPGPLLVLCGLSLAGCGECLRAFAWECEEIG